MYNKFKLSIQKKIKKIPKEQIFYKGYDLTQAYYRLYFSEKRKPVKIPHNNLKIFNSIKNLILKLPILKIFIKKEKTDFMIVSNTKYKVQKALDAINVKPRNKIAVIQDFKNNLYSRYNNINYFIVKKFPFFSENDEPIKKNELSEFLILKKKLDLFEKIINFYEPNKIYIVEGDSVTDALIGQICKKKNIECLCLQHGFNPILFYSKNSKFHFKNFLYDFTYLVDSKLTGEYLKFKKIIHKYKVLKNKIKFNNLKDKNKILFGVSTFSIDDGLNQKSIYYFADMILHFLKKFPNIKVIIRLHPDGLTNKIILNQIPKSKNVEFHFSQEKSLKESFEDSKISCFLAGSSLIADSINYLCVPVVLRLVKVDTYNFSGLKKYKVAHITDTFSDFKNKVSDLIINKKRLQSKQKNIEIFLKNFYK